MKTMMQAVKLSCAGNAEEEDSYSRRHEEKEVPAANMAPTTCWSRSGIWLCPQLGTRMA